MLHKKQEQSSGNNSHNHQAGRDIVIHGLSYTETKDLVKEEAQKVFKENSLVLAEDAYKLVLRRSEELLDNFLKKLEEKKPEALESMRDPGMQYSLFNAQKEYAKTGDKELADLLEDILVERANRPQRDLLQIVLDECVSIAPKLTPDQFDALTIVFLLRYTINHSVTNLSKLFSYLAKYVIPFSGGIRKEVSRYQHLEFVSCGTVGVSSISIEQVIRTNYMGLFSKGFTIEEFESRVGKDEKYKRYLMRSLHDFSKYQIKFNNKEVMEETGKSDGLTREEINKLIGFFEETTMPENEVKDYLIQKYPPIEGVFKSWEESSIKNMTLTSVGLAIGHANLTRKTKETFDLNIWIN